MFRDLISGKNVLFITTHRIDYIRCRQELDIINQEATSVRVLYGKVNNHVISSLKILIWLLFNSTKKYDVVVVSYMCQLIVPFMYWRFKSVLIVDFFISLYDSLVYDRKIIRKNSVASKFIHYLDKSSVDKANLVIADTIAHSEFFRQEYEISSDKMEVMYLSADKTIYYPMNVEKPKEWGCKYLVIYFGTVIPLQGFDIVLKAIEILKKDTNIHFVIIGPVSSKYNGGLNNATFIRWLEQDELSNYIAMADLCLAGHFNGDIKKADRTIPTKAYIYEAMNKTMILGDSTANHELFKEDNYHFYVKMGDADQLAQRILEIKEMSFGGSVNE